MKVKELILQVENISFQNTLKYILKNSEEKNKKTFIVTLNPELIMLAKEDNSYERVLKSADLIVCDGIGVVLAGKIFGKNLSERIRGVDLVDKVSEAISILNSSKQARPLTVGFLGGGKNVAQSTAECLKSKYPGLNVSFARVEWDEIKGNMSCDILFVAFGSPKQETWIYENLPNMDVKVAIGVGGAFDFISGRVRRAPAWIRRLGLEWLFRLIIQPWRWKRQTKLIKFIFLVIKEKILD